MATITLSSAYKEHLFYVFDLYDPTHDNETRAYLTSLSNLVRLAIRGGSHSGSHDGHSRVKVDNVTVFILDVLKSFKPFSVDDDTRWATILWQIIYTFPQILDKWAASNTTVIDDIRITLTMMPVVAIPCKKRCAEHMQKYIEAHPIDISNGKNLKLWIDSFKNDIKKHG